MIVLFPDFGLAGPYTGQLHAVLQHTAPGVPVIQLFADAPAGQPRPSAYLLEGYQTLFTAGPAKAVGLSAGGLRDVVPRGGGAAVRRRPRRRRGAPAADRGSRRTAV